MTFENNGGYLNMSGKKQTFKSSGEGDIKERKMKVGLEKKVSQWHIQQ